MTILLEARAGVARCIVMTIRIRRNRPAVRDLLGRVEQWIDAAILDRVGGPGDLSTIPVAVMLSVLAH